MNIGIKLKKIREKNNLKQEELAGILKITQRTLSSWENNKIEPPIHQLMFLANKFQVDMNYFVYEYSEMAPSENKNNGTLLALSNKKSSLNGSLSHEKSSLNDKKMSGSNAFENVRKLSVSDTNLSVSHSENEQENKVSIDYYPDVFLAAGYNGSAINETKESIEVPKYLLNGLDTRGVVMLNVVGDSMEPKMADGDKILVKPSIDNTLKPAIYACWLNNNLIVKQLQWVGFNLLEVKSLNSQFNTYTLDLKNRDDNAFKIIGEVVFVFHKM